MKQIIIVGAGILGAAITYKLVKQAAGVIMIDRNDEML